MASLRRDAIVTEHAAMAGDMRGGDAMARAAAGMLRQSRRCSKDQSLQEDQKSHHARQDRTRWQSSPWQ